MELTNDQVCHVVGIFGLLFGLAFHVDVARPWW